MRKILTLLLTAALVGELFVGAFLLGRKYEQDRWIEYDLARETEIQTQEEYILETARKVARKHGIDEDMVLSIIWQESKFRPFTASQRGAKGLMQLMPDTAKDLKVKDVYSISENIDAGVRYIAWLKSLNLSHSNGVLIAYNWGIGNYRKWMSGQIKNLPKETEDYIEKVHRHMRTKPWSRI